MENKVKDTTGGVSESLRNAAMIHDEGKRIITDDTMAAFELQAVDRLMRELANPKLKPFYWTKIGQREVPQSTPLGKQLINAVKYDLVEIRCLYPKARFSPYFQLFEALVEPLRPKLELFDAESLPVWEGLVEAVKAGIRSPAFAAKRRAHERGVRENYSGLLRYMTDMLALNSKVLAVRVDVGTKMEHTQHVSFEDMQRYRDELMDFIRSTGEGFFIGYAWRIEHGQTRHYHMHVLVFYNGQRVRQDVTIARIIGDRWVREITGGKGYYHNCNAHKDEYKYCGIGLLSRLDESIREGLRRIAEYMTKPSYHLDLNVPPGARTFGRTAYPKNTPAKLEARRRQREQKAEAARLKVEQDAAYKHVRKLFSQLKTFSPTRKVVVPRHPRPRRQPAL